MRLGTIVGRRYGAAVHPRRLAAARARGSDDSRPHRRRGCSSRIRRITSLGASKDQLAKIRQWARANGHQVSDRGRISAAVPEAYHAAN